MNNVLIWAIGSTFVVSLLSLAGVFSFAIKDKLLNKILMHLVGFSAGALIGGAFLHLLPEALEEFDSLNIFIYLILGIIIFFLMERILHWHHCHEGKECEVHTFTYMNLIGDGIHNFIDGLVVVSAYVVDIRLGIVTTLAIMAHELPQEFGDFGVLVYGGFSKARALGWNFISAVTAVFGAVIGYFISNALEGFTPFLLPFAAGGFIYIAMSDLIPELHKEKKLSKSLVHFSFFLLGVLFMLLAKIYLGE